RVPETVVAADSASEPVIEPLATVDSVAVEPDTLPKTVMIVGDSMLEGLSPRLAAYCEASGHTLYTVIWYSSTTKEWGGDKRRLETYMREYKPDFIFISLGANELFVKDIIDTRRDYVREIKRQLGSTPYLWIGPPNWKKDTGINELLRQELPQGRFFVSDGMHFDRKKDGAHPTAESAVVWMDSIARWMPDHAASQLMLHQPEKKTGRPKKIFVHAINE
ncbi:MAG: hypothetical protein K2N16_00020, partial [Muribaculaceae bacterium]|nr:hypothetical protein [Muribaculaceae bacterium]